MLKKKKALKKKITKKNKIKKVSKKIKKTAKKKVASSRKTKKVKKAAPKIKKNILGIITHYFPHVNAAVIKLKMPLNTGDTIKIKGHTTDLTQIVTSMQMDREPINSAKKGQEIGVLVNSRVRQHDIVYKA